jgi:hypothetical protein
VRAAQRQAWGIATAGRPAARRIRAASALAAAQHPPSATPDAPPRVALPPRAAQEAYKKRLAENLLEDGKDAKILAFKSKARAPRHTHARTRTRPATRCSALMRMHAPTHTPTCAGARAARGL